MSEVSRAGDQKPETIFPNLFSLQRMSLTEHRRLRSNQKDCPAPLYLSHAYARRVAKIGVRVHYTDYYYKALFSLASGSIFTHTLRNSTSAINRTSQLQIRNKARRTFVPTVGSVVSR